MDRYGLLGLVAALEVVALEHSRDRMFRRKLDQTCRTEWLHPARVELQPRALGIENLVDLRLVGLGIRRNLVFGQRRPRGVLARRITDHSSEIADQKNDVVAELLKLSHLVQQHRVPEMKIGRRGIEPCLDLERTPCCEALAELVLEQNLVGAASELI